MVIFKYLRATNGIQKRAFSRKFSSRSEAESRRDQIFEAFAVRHTMDSEHRTGIIESTRDETEFRGVRLHFGDTLEVSVKITQAAQMPPTVDMTLSWAERALAAAREEAEQKRRLYEEQERRKRISQMGILKDKLRSIGLSDMADHLADDAPLPSLIDGLLHVDFGPGNKLRVARALTHSERANVHIKMRWSEARTLADIGRILDPKLDQSSLTVVDTESPAPAKIGSLDGEDE